MDPILEQEVIAELPAGDATVETTPAAETTQAAASFNDRRKAWTPEQTAQWKLTGEEPAAAPTKNSDEHADPSTAEAETTSQDGSVENEAAPATVETKEQKSKRTQFSELREKATRAEAERDLLKQQLADALAASGRKSPTDTATEKPAVTTVVRPKRPNLNDPKFKTLDEYEAEMDKYETKMDEYNQAVFDSRINETVSTVEESRTRKQIETDRATATARMEKIYPDYKAVAFSAKVPASDAMLSVLDKLPQGPEIRYALGKNIAEATRIAKLTDIEGLAELSKTNPSRAAYLWGKAEAQAEIELGKLAKPKPALTKKPEPPKPTSEVSVNGSGKVEVLDDTALMKAGKISAAEWKRRQNAADAEAWKAGTR